VEKLITVFEKNDMTRLLAFGSSNTQLGQHADGCFNWFNWLDVGLGNHVGRKLITINSGISGDTCAQLLERYERDCAFFKPDIVIVTIGGNDSNPERGITPEKFRELLEELISRLKENKNCRVMLQTYYSFDIEKLPESEKGWGNNFPVYMEIVRQTAKKSDCLLIDHLVRWEKLRKADVVLYRKLMRDTKHLTPLGNMVMGLDTLRAFGAWLTGELPAQCKEGTKIQKLMDKLEGTFF